MENYLRSTESLLHRAHTDSQARLSTAPRQMSSHQNLAPAQVLVFEKEKQEAVLYLPDCVSQSPLPECLLLSTGQHSASDLKIRPASGLVVNDH